MAVYEFNCEPCQAVHEVRARMDEIVKLEPTCPACGNAMTRKYSVLAVKVHPLASDVLDRACRGEGDAAPGLTKDQTHRAALAMAAARKQRVPRNPNLRKRSAPLTVYT